MGDDATSTLSSALRRKLLAAIPTDQAPLLTRQGVLMTIDTIVQALELPSTRVWVPEQDLRRDGAQLRVRRWACNEGEAENPRMWQWTPRATIINVVTGWLTPQGCQWIAEWKKNRALHIQGYS